MTLIDEIREAWASKLYGFRALETVDSSYPAYAMRVDDYFGVAVPYTNSLVVAEHFSNAQLHSRQRILGDSKEQR